MTRTLEILERLISFPTVSQDSNLDLINWVQGLLDEWGFEVTRIPSPCGRKAGLLAQIGPKIKGGICLSGHTDVVPVKGQNWTRDPFKLSREDGRVFGRGTTDMKGFLASALALSERAQGQALRAPLSLVLSYDEEVGCVGIQEMLPALAPLLGKPKVVIVGEPTSMQIATGHKGKAALRVTCKGEAGHSALAPNFTNGIHVAAHFVGQMRELQDGLSGGPQDTAYDIPYSTVHVGKIAGGQALNMVPDQVVLDMEYRHLTDTGPEIFAQIEAAAQRCASAFEVGVSVERLNAYPGLDLDPRSPVIDWAKTITSGAGTKKVAFGTEAGFFSALGLNAIVIGPGDMNTDGHKPDEGIALAELAACDQMMADILRELVY